MKSYSVTDFSGALADANSADSIWDITTKFFGQYELDGLVYLDANENEFTLRSTLPESWHQHYLDAGYAKIDPFAEICCTSFALIATGEANPGLYSHMSQAQHNWFAKSEKPATRPDFPALFGCSDPKGLVDGA